MKQKLINILKYTGIGIGSLFGLLVVIAIFSPTPDVEESNTEQDQVVQEENILAETENIEEEEIQEEPEIVEEEPVQETTTAPEVTQESEPEPQEQTPVVTYYNVTKVVDGDTVKISMNGSVTTLRLIGMDTPETVDPRKPVQCFGVEASNKAKELLSGKKVRLEYDTSQGEQDKYGRTLAYIYTEDGTLFNKYMIEQGYAYEYTYDEAYKYQSEFKQAEATAKATNKGLWSPDTCNGEATSVEEETETQSQVQSDTTGSKYYTSSHYTAKYYYPEDCDAWEGLSETYLKSFDSLENLLNQYGRSLSPQC